MDSALSWKLATALLLCLYAIALWGCQSSGDRRADPTPVDLFGEYRDDTPEHLIDSFILAWNAYDDASVYHFSTPLKEQNEETRDAFIADGAEKCRWKADWWGVEDQEYSDDRTRLIMNVKMVVSAEGYTSLSTMRFTCENEGARWLVSNHEWVGEYLDLRDYPTWLYETEEP